MVNHELPTFWITFGNLQTFQGLVGIFKIDIIKLSTTFSAEIYWRQIIFENIVSSWIFEFSNFYYRQISFYVVNIWRGTPSKWPSSVSAINSSVTVSNFWLTVSNSAIETNRKSLNLMTIGKTCFEVLLSMFIIFC